MSKFNTGVATGLVDAITIPGPEHRMLEAFIGKWLTEGETTASIDGPPARIFASDVYEWGPGGFCVVHTAYGRIGSIDAGGVEIISYDPERREYVSHFFDSFGNASVSRLRERDGAWTWQGEHTRCRSVFSDGGRTMTAHHERSEDGLRWMPSMVVTLTRID